MTKELNDRLFAALGAVSDVLSDVPDAEWDKVEDIQGAVNRAMELVARLDDAILREDA